MRDDIDISKAAEKLDYTEETLRLWRVLDEIGDRLRYAGEDMTKEQARQIWNDIRQKVTEANEYALRSPHFKRLVGEPEPLRQEQFTESHETFMQQLAEYLVRAEKERRQEMQNLFQESMEELKEAQEAIEETEEILDDLQDSGLL